MHRRTFCRSALAAAVAATLPGCGAEQSTELAGSLPGNLFRLNANVSPG